MRTFSCFFASLLFSCALLTTGQCSAMTDFSGTVLDKQNGKPIAGATILIADLKIGGSTDENGHFQFSNISEGRHLIEISHVGYATWAESITISGQTVHQFFLSVSVVENNAVVVTGVSRATQLKKVPFQVELISSKDLFQTTSTNVIESITSKAGISSISSGPAISKPLIRGLGYNRVLVINDGVRQEGQQWGDEHGIEVDDASVNKIEVLKGPASLAYGSDALAGVINIISNVPAPLNTVHMNIGSEYQSNNSLRSFHANTGGNQKGFSWNAYGSYKAAMDYRNRYDGPVFNSRFENKNFGGYAGINKSWGFSHVLFSSFDLKAGLTEGERDSLGRFIKTLAGGGTVEATSDDFHALTPDFPYQHIRHRKLATDNKFKIGAHSLNFNIGYQENTREEFGNPDQPQERELYFDLKTITYAAQFHFKENRGWKHSLGCNGMDQQNENKGIAQLIPNYHLFDYGVYYFGQKDWKKLSFTGGVRFDNRRLHAENLMENNTIKNSAFSQSFTNFSASAGITYTYDSNLNFKLNIARAFRAPGIPELASDGAHEGTIRYEYGNRGLKSEISTQADAAMELAYDHFRLNVAGYLNHFNNFIFYRKLRNTVGSDSLVEDHGTLLSAFTFDQQKAVIAGAELTLDIHPHPLDWLHIENTFSIVSGKFMNRIDGSVHLPFIPAPRLLTEFKADLNCMRKSMQQGFVKLEIDNTFEQSHPFTGYNTETATKGYVLINAGFGADIINAKKKKLAVVYVAVNNLFDVAYQNHLSHLKYAPDNLLTGRRGVYNMGRNFSIRVNVPLNWKI